MNEPGDVHHIFSIIFGYIAVACFALLYAPQVILNYQLKSTEGFSLALSIIWHIGGSLTFATYVYEEADYALIVQFGVFLI